MTYSVKELFYTLQGEGAQAGRAAVFCRFAGCNLWTGREQDRATAVCTFCDTDFVGTNGEGGGKFATADALADTIAKAWPRGGEGNPSHDRGKPYVVCTGGEPLLQLDAPLIAALHARGFEVAVETNGTQPAPPGLDWICVSPKRFAGLDFQHFFLQPMDSVLKREHTKAAVAYCMQHPQWRLSVQMHKVVGIA
jgi:7-carboxy-7-deazaguanine synthase (Cx14CxxC type)